IAAFPFPAEARSTEERSQGPLSDQGPETVHRRAIPSQEANTNLTHYPLITFGAGTFALAIAEQVDVRNTRAKRKCSPRSPIAGLCQQRKSRLFDHFVANGRALLQWSLGQPGSPQSFFQSREVFSTPIRAQQVFDSGNTQRGI